MDPDKLTKILTTIAAIAETLLGIAKITVEVVKTCAQQDTEDPQKREPNCAALEKQLGCLSDLASKTRKLVEKYAIRNEEFEMWDRLVGETNHKAKSYIDAYKSMNTDGNSQETFELCEEVAELKRKGEEIKTEIWDEVQKRQQSDFMDEVRRKQSEFFKNTRNQQSEFHEASRHQQSEFCREMRRQVSELVGEIRRQQSEFVEEIRQVVEAR